MKAASSLRKRITRVVEDEEALGHQTFSEEQPALVPPGPLQSDALGQCEGLGLSCVCVCICGCRAGCLESLSIMEDGQREGGVLRHFTFTAEQSLVQPAALKEQVV